MNNTEYKELIEKLNNIEAIAYGYNINGEVLGMDCSDFEQIMVDSAVAITELIEILAKVTAERDAAIKYLKIAADDNGRCYGCKWLNEATEACTHKLGREACDSVSNNMWEWKGI